MSSLNAAPSSAPALTAARLAEPAAVAMAAPPPPPAAAALVTGGASGIGAGLCRCLALDARFRAAVTVLDLDGAAAERVAAEIRGAGGRARAAACDVAAAAEQARAFADHLRAYGRLDYACLNAGVMERGDVLHARGAGAADGGRWRETLAVNFAAVADGAGLAARAMAASGGRGGTVMVTASAGGVFPMPSAPVYAASKAACIAFVRSLAPQTLARFNVRLVALCPQFVDTPLVRGIFASRGAAGAEALMRESGAAPALLPAAAVVEAGSQLLAGGGAPGCCLVILANGRLMEVAQPPRLRPARLGAASAASAAPVDPALRAWATRGGAPLPTTHRRVVVRRLSPDFRAATAVEAAPLAPPPPGHVLLRVAFAGVNASDVNFTSGRYDAAAAPPFPAGFEAVGAVAALGPGVAGVAMGAPYAAMLYGAFAEYLLVPETMLLPVARATPAAVALLASGLTASIALEVAGRPAAGETVLVTAAAGGTGQFAVQLAKAAGCRVVATCGSPAKAALLRALGADAVVDHAREDVAAALRAAAPAGVDVVYESVGGEMLELASRALAPKGRLVIIGMVSQYAAGWTPQPRVGLPERLLKKGATMAGFFLPLHAGLFRRHLARLAAMEAAGTLKVGVDACRFVGVEAAADAVEHLLSGRSAGKVVLQVAADAPPGGAAAPAARL